MAMNLVWEPWIPVIDAEGKAREYSIYDTLLNAHRLRAIRDPMPTVEFGLHRLLASIVMDIYKLSGWPKLRDVIRSGKFDETEIRAYFDQWASRFELFYSDSPFLQNTDTLELPIVSVALLVHSVPTGTNVIHHHHAYEREFAIGPKAAARLLTTLAPFCTAGGRGKSPSINGAPPWYLLITGNTLFETICMNYPASSAAEQQLGLPAWRRQGDLPDRAVRVTMLEAYTWQPRKLSLIPVEEPGICSVTGERVTTVIRDMRFGNGATCDELLKENWQDPAIAYRVRGKNDGDQRERYPARPSEGKPLWRDCGPLLLLDDERHAVMRPKLIDQFEQLAKDRVPPTQLGFCMYGMRTDLKTKVFEWYAEPLTLPQGLILKRSYHRAILQMLTDADDIALLVKRAIKKTGPEGKEVFEGLANHQVATFWFDIRPIYQHHIEEIATLAESSDAEKVLDRRLKFFNAVTSTAIALFERTINGFTANGRQIFQSQATARRGLLDDIAKKRKAMYPKDSSVPKGRSQPPKESTI